MELTSYHRSSSAVWADALCVSALQRSDNPSAGQVRQATAAAVRAHGGQGCAERVVQEFGDHPENAVMRMRWARVAVTEVFGSALQLTHRPAPKSPQRLPTVLVTRSGS